MLKLWSIRTGCVLSQCHFGEFADENKKRTDCLGMLVQCSIKFSGTHLYYTWLEIARLT